MIKNIILDVGNVIVKWQPAIVVSKLFPNEDATQLTQLLFKSPTWYDLNLGKITEIEAIKIYHQTLGIDLEQLNILMHEVKESLLPIEHSFELMMQLHQLQYTLYALTDNVPEIMAYLKQKYTFWHLFTGIVVSAEVGYLKPMPEIYKKLFDTYRINPAESVFIDDHPPNIVGAKAVGLQAIQFISAEQCVNELNKILATPLIIRN